MKVGVLLPVPRMDKYGYQYNEFTKIILRSQTEFADQVLALSSSRYCNRELFDEFNKVRLISNNLTWFELVNGQEIFSIKKAVARMNFGLQKLKELGLNVAIIIHTNQYVPKSSMKKIKNRCNKMVEKREPFSWLYKSYQCGNLLFHADSRIPWIFNLNLNLNWEIGPDSISHKETHETKKIQSGNFKKYDNEAIRDIFGEFTILDVKKKYNFTIKELRILNKTYNPRDQANLKFNEERWLNYMDNKFKLKKIIKKPLDSYGREILNIRKDGFISNFIGKSIKNK